MNYANISGKISVIFACVLLLATGASAQVSLRSAVDTDKDGKADFTIVRPSNNGWYTYRSGGGFAIQQFGVANTDTPAPGDYDGDGKADLSVYRDTDGIWYRINSSDGTFVGVKFGITGDEPVARDYDGDGTTDIAVVRRSNGYMVWYILGSLDGFSATQFGLSGDFTAPGDYDGDKKFDLAIQRPGATPTSQANFYILKSTDKSFYVVPWGYSKDFVAPGDYDGDGKTDIAVVREGVKTTDNMVWYALRSTDGSLLALQFGLSDQDIICQNDYDGDGKTDPAVWRNTTGMFYYLGSNNGFSGLSAVQWGSPNDFPVAGYDTH